MTTTAPARPRETGTGVEMAGEKPAGGYVLLAHCGTEQEALNAAEALVFMGAARPHDVQTLHEDRLVVLREQMPERSYRLTDFWVDLALVVGFAVLFTVVMLCCG